MYLWMQITNRARCYNPRWGTKGMPTKTDRAANRCRSLYDATRRDGEQVGGAAGRTRGVPRTARASSKPAQVRNGAEDAEREQEQREREAPNRFGSTSSSLREIAFFFDPFPFIARQEAVWHLIPNNRIYLPRIFACTYFRPYMLLGARVCEESVPMPLFSDSSCGRFSSRQRFF